VTVGGRTQVHDLPGGGSYLSASERKVFLGVGTARQIDRLSVIWPNGPSEFWRDLPIKNTVRIQAGTGTPLEAAPLGVQ
jgi:hypothetical protein